MRTKISRHPGVVLWEGHAARSVESVTIRQYRPPSLPDLRTTHVAGQSRVLQNGNASSADVQMSGLRGNTGRGSGLLKDGWAGHSPSPWANSEPGRTSWIFILAEGPTARRRYGRVGKENDCSSETGYTAGAAASPEAAPPARFSHRRDAVEKN
jgi:hypothetical protein